MNNAISTQVDQRQPRKRQYRYLRFKLLPGDEALLPHLSEDRRALVMAEGTYGEIAERFGIPIGTVRSRLHRARALISQLRAIKADKAPEMNGLVH